MKKTLQIAASLLLLAACNSETRRTTNETETTLHSSMTEELFSRLQWMNAPSSFSIQDSTLAVEVAKGTDFFNNPEDQSVVGSAPLLYRETSGDFVAKALVEPDFNSQWNGVSLMMYVDSLHWIKLAFENSDATGPSIVTVVTDMTSDDSNGVIHNDRKVIWLALVKKNNIYSMHWSKDGVDFNMARLTSLPPANKVRIGAEFQSPVGEVATHKLHAFNFEARTVEDLRKLK